MPFFENASNFLVKNCTFTINADGSKETWTCHDANADGNPSPFIPPTESTRTSSSSQHLHLSVPNTCEDPFVNPDDPPILAEESFIEDNNPNGVRRRHATRRSGRPAHGNHHSVTTTTTRTTIVSMNSNNTRTVVVRDSFNNYDGGKPPRMPFRKRSIHRWDPSLDGAAEEKGMAATRTEKD